MPPPPLPTAVEGLRAGVTACESWAAQLAVCCATCPELDPDTELGARVRLVRDLVRMVLDVGSVPLAEGVEFEADADLCRDMGFSLLQGYHTGRPVPVESLS